MNNHAIVYKCKIHSFIMSWKNWPPWLKGVALVLIVILVVVIYLVASSSIDNLEIPAECKNLKDNALAGIYDRTNCVQSLAIESGDPSLCEQVISRLGCYKDVAISTGNPEICDGIASSNNIEKPNVGIKFRCYKAVAISEKNELICDLISVEHLKQNCIDEVIG
jgi:hypothetical protein